jgi:hypothetical protein
MARLDDVVELLKENPGLSDREITDRLYGTNQPQQPINGICRRLAGKKLIVRRDRQDGILGLQREMIRMANINPELTDNDS